MPTTRTSTTPRRRDINSLASKRQNTHLLLARTTEEKTKDEEELLSDIDAKVLRSLMEENPDVTTKENLQRMLTRDAEAKVKRRYRSPSSEKNQYSSEFFQKLDSSSSSSLWNSFKARAGSFLESASLYVLNRVERDVKLLGALGMFAIERALRDSSRLLPSKSSRKEKDESVLPNFSGKNLLPGQSSYTKGQPLVLLKRTENDPMNDIEEQLTTPNDEIKKVLRTIQQILSGETTDTSQSKKLKSTAAKKGVRSRQQRRKKKKKPTFSVVDATYEFQREMKMEEPGYKTKGVREQVFGEETRARLRSAADSISKSISGGADAPTGALPGEEASTAQPAEPVESVETETITEEKPTKAIPILLPQETRQQLTRNIQSCIQNPAETWLIRGTTIDPADTTIKADDLRQTITKMIYFRENLQKEDFSQTVEQVKQSIREILDVAENAAGSKASRFMRDVLIPENDPVLYDEDTDEYVSAATVVDDDASSSSTRTVPFFATTAIDVEVGEVDTDVQEQTPTEMFNKSPPSTIKEPITIIEESLKSRDTSLPKKKPLEALDVEYYVDTTTADGDKKEEKRGSWKYRDVEIDASTKTIAEDLSKKKEIHTTATWSTIPPHAYDATPCATYAASPTDVNTLYSSPPATDTTTPDTVPPASPDTAPSVTTTSSTTTPATTTTASYTANPTATPATTTSYAATPVATTTASYTAAPTATPATTTSYAATPVTTTASYTAPPTATTSYSTPSSTATSVEIIHDEEEDEMIEKKFTKSAAVTDATFTEEEEEEKEPEDNALVSLSLRSLDVVFYVTEKTLTVLIPNVLTVSSTVSSRIEHINRNGLGYEGWKRLKSTKSASKRY